LQPLILEHDVDCAFGILHSLPLSRQMY
jgi:hypothetical protein